MSIHLHPTFPLFRGGAGHPACPECQQEILPMQAVTLERMPDGKVLFRHEECDKEWLSENPGPPPVTGGDGEKEAV